MVEQQPPDFYAIAAQVLPVSFLTLSFQMRGGIVPSPVEDVHEEAKRLRAKFVENVKEAQKLRHKAGEQADARAGV